MKSDKKNNRRHMHMNTYKHADTFNKKNRHKQTKTDNSQSYFVDFCQVVYEQLDKHDCKTNKCKKSL